MQSNILPVQGQQEAARVGTVQKGKTGSSCGTLWCGMVPAHLPAGAYWWFLIMALLVFSANVSQLGLTFYLAGASLLLSMLYAKV